MDQEQIFKVPPVKKKRPDLYCKETLDGLDDVWKCSKKTAQVLESPLRSQPICTKKTSNRWNEKWNPDSYKQSEVPSLRLLHSSHKYEYAVGLLNEFSKNIFTAEGSDTQSCRLARQHPTSNMSSMTEMSATCCSDEDVSMPLDALIVPDQMDCSEIDSLECDVNWDSLTPPAPRSPGDHTVPDLYDLESICPPSDCLVDAYDRLASVQTIQTRGGIGDREVHMSSAQRNALGVPAIPASDHIVPDFYI
ncbi:hypothetical protein RRG08_042654 [Elysia crispata]|uniref:Uncharacterized protein n=1 Tax=Elysia crispata TaxID=231223 RepID=A0AAE1CKF1_9GAST|nr:hypothetical protein RRG08_042654 [Elysia crispata]